jgi:hypothetical protein
MVAQDASRSGTGWRHRLEGLAYGYGAMLLSLHMWNDSLAAPTMLVFSAAFYLLAYAAGMRLLARASIAAAVVAVLLGLGRVLRALSEG